MVEIRNVWDEIKIVTLNWDAGPQLVVGGLKSP